MSRSVNDATRFTPTGPQAHSRSGLNAAAKAASPAALERVARLRAAAMKAQEAKLTRFDRIILAGRKVADRAHKTTLYFLITATGTSHPVPFLPPAIHESGYGKRKTHPRGVIDC